MLPRSAAECEPYAPNRPESAGKGANPLNFTIFRPGTGRNRPLGGHRLAEIFVHFFEEAGGGEPFLLCPDEERQVLGHVTGLDGLHDGLLEGRRKLDQGVIVVELAAMSEAARPGID